MVIVGIYPHSTGTGYAGNYRSDVVYVERPRDQTPADASFLEKLGDLQATSTLSPTRYALPFCLVTIAQALTTLLTCKPVDGKQCLTVLNFLSRIEVKRPRTHPRSVDFSPRLRPHTERTTHQPIVPPFRPAPSVAHKHASKLGEVRERIISTADLPLVAPARPTPVPHTLPTPSCSRSFPQQVLPETRRRTPPLHHQQQRCFRKPLAGK